MGGFFHEIKKIIRGIAHHMVVIGPDPGENSALWPSSWKSHARLMKK
jgi:hypothetical protein